jgi:hypothetical protein
MNFNTSPDAKRIVIRVRATDLLGIPEDRQNTAARIFCEAILRRPFRPELQLTTYDHAHAMPNWDTDKPIPI